MCCEHIRAQLMQVADVPGQESNLRWDSINAAWTLTVTCPDTKAQSPSAFAHADIIFNSEQDYGIAQKEQAAREHALEEAKRILGTSAETDPAGK